MLLEQFYDVLDKALEAIIAENQEDITERKLNQVNQQKSYALLIRFLQMYAPNKLFLFKDCITDGKDDSSCDIIFSNKENGEEIFYIVQSKWNIKPKIKEGNQVEKISSDEVKKAIVDFESIFRKDKKKGKNKLFNEKLNDLQKHLANNGAVKFIFLGLLPHNEEVNEHIRNFERLHAPLAKMEVLDLERLRRDFIEFRYKKIEVQNPLAYRYFDPTEDDIMLEIERIENSQGKGDHLKIEKPYEAYIFLLKPKTIFDLFEKYKFSLFFRNVRNPLPESNYNQAIVDTLNHKPEMFWYFNNGITAITKLIKPIGLGTNSQIANLIGLQIINGAQTVYSIYSAYKNANKLQREIMDSYTKITLRLIGSSNNERDLEITRYTNSQNPMEARDFWANDPVQIRLQEESFKTKYWYERRRGEFREIHEGVEVVSNEEFALAYGNFYLEISPIDYSFSISRYAFFSEKEKHDGLYEKIFNENTNFEDMLGSLFMYRVFIIYLSDKISGHKNNFQSSKAWDSLMAISKIVFKKSITKKYGEKANFNKMLTKYYHKDQEKLIDMFFWIYDVITDKYLSNFEQFDLPDLKQHFETLDFPLD